MIQRSLRPALVVLIGLLLVAFVDVSARGGPVPLQADESVDLDLEDSDGDLLPRIVEQMLRTSPLSTDSDSDGEDDFEEVVTTQNHLSNSSVLMDHGLRVMVSASKNANGVDEVWIHLIVRTVGVSFEDVKFHGLQLRKDGVAVPIEHLLCPAGMRVAFEQHKNQECRYVFSMRLTSEATLAALSPCTIVADFTIESRPLRAGNVLEATRSGVASLLPHSESSFALLPINSSNYIQDSNPYYRGGGRVCEMGLIAVGESSSGTICEVDWADCKPAAGLRCTSTCAQRTGKVMVVPDGLSLITGGN